jgi:hypothetical protein
MLRDVLAASEVAFGRLFDPRGRQRHKDVVLRRHALMYVAKTLTGRSLVHIGSVFGCDHSSVSYAVASIRRQIATDSEVAALVKTLEGITTDIWRARTQQSSDQPPQPREDCLT